MSAKIRRLKIVVALTIAISLVIVLLTPSPVVPATICKADSDSVPLYIQDFSVVPQPIVDDASGAAAELFGNNQQKCRDFTGQLLATYLEAKDKDIVVIFNAGGWGWDSIDDSPGWKSIIDGIKAELSDLGYTYLILEHKRTAHTLNGCLSEFMFTAYLYPMKAEDLAARVEFLTRHIPDIRIILTGESNGTSICSSTLHILQENTKVYSILTGPPFWNNNIASDRSLILRGNGATPDTFSSGDIITIIRSNLEAMFGISQQYPGNILFYIGAPGHDYNWEYEEVHSRITNFLNNNFSPE